MLNRIDVREAQIPDSLLIPVPINRVGQHKLVGAPLELGIVGQVMGGIAQGIGQALTEKIVFDESFNLVVEASEARGRGLQSEGEIGGRGASATKETGVGAEVHGLLRGSKAHRATEDRGEGTTGGDNVGRAPTPRARVKHFTTGRGRRFGRQSSGSGGERDPPAEGAARAVGSRRSLA